MEHIEKHEKTGRIRENDRKTCENGESGENIEKQGKTGRIKENRKTWENRENQGKT